MGERKSPYGMLAILMIGAFIALLNNTLLNVALPTIMKEFDVTTTTVQWLSTGYMLVNGIMMPMTAFFIQKYSIRRLFLVGIGVFALGTIAAGFSGTFFILLISRMLQACGSALLMPLLMNVILVSFPIEKRGSAMGLLGLVMIFAPAIGPTLSGWLIEHYDWPMLFHVISPIAIAVFFIGFFLLKDTKETQMMKLDVLSLLLSSIGFGGLLYGFSAAGDKGWGSAAVLVTLIIGAVGLISFILHQLKMKNPVLEFRVYRYPMFALSSMISIIVSMTMFSGMILLPVYLQNIREISPLHSGLLMLPGAIIMGIMSPINGFLFDKVGARILAVIGLIITVITSYTFSNLTVDTTYVHLIMMYTARMFGMSMIMMPVMTNGLNQLPQKYNPHGTAMNSTLQQVAGALGSALLVTVMSNQTKEHAKELAQNAMNQAASQSPTQMSVEAMAQMKQGIMMKAMTEGIDDAFLVATGFAVVALILAFFIKRTNLSPENKSEEVAI